MGWTGRCSNHVGPVGREPRLWYCISSRLLRCYDLYPRDCIFSLAFVWFKGTSYILAHHLYALLFLSLIIIFCYWNFFILSCCVICIAFFLLRFPFMSLPITPYHSRGGRGAYWVINWDLPKISVQGTFFNSTTRLRVRVPLRKVCAIILVYFITMDLSHDRKKTRSPRLGVHKFFTGTISKL